MSSSILVKGRGRPEGYENLATPDNSLLRWLSCGRLGVAQGNPYNGFTGEQECVIDILDGMVTLEAEGKRYQSLGDRTAPYGGPTLMCLPPHVHYQIASDTPIADLFVISADADPGEAVTIVKPEDAPVRHVGQGNWERHVWPGTAIASGTKRLIVGETMNLPGNWSSFPPHKHDTNDPPEGVYEEIYFFLIRPRGGFGLSRIYERRETADALNEAVVVEEGDTVIIPRGYHTVVAAPGYELRYVWALCGTERAYGAWRDDPAYVWVRDDQPPPTPVEIE